MQWTEGLQKNDNIIEEFLFKSNKESFRHVCG